MAKSRRAENLLTAVEVQRALQSGKRQDLDDGGSLKLKIRDVNIGTWRYRGRVSGTQDIVQVSWPAPGTSLKDARRLRNEFRDKLRSGINPTKELKQAKLQEERDNRTFADVAEEYFASREDWPAKALSLARGRMKNHMASLMPMRIVDIRRGEHIKPVLTHLVENGHRDLANRVAGLIGRIFMFALNNDYIETNCAMNLSTLLPRRRPGEHKHHPAETETHRFASVLTRLWGRLDAGHSSSSVRAAMMLTCYMPARNGDIVSARWEDVDLSKGVWHFPNTKNGRTYKVPLTRQLRTIFEELPRHNEWCLPSYGGTGCVTHAAMRRFLRDAGIERTEQSLHGFRSSFQTIALEHGIPKALTEQLLFHVAGGSVEQAYNRANYFKAIEQALQWWDDTIDALRTGKDIPKIPDELRGLYG